MFSKVFPENRAFCEIMSKKMVESEKPQVAIWRRITCWISKTTRPFTQAHSPTCPHTRAQKYVIVITSAG
jgi:hypothetical protein